MTARIGHRQPVERMIGDRTRDRVFREAIGEPHDPGGKGEQREQPDHGQQSQQHQDVRLGLGAAQGHKGYGRGNDRTRHQQHKKDASASPRRLMHGGERGTKFVARIGCHLSLFARSPQKTRKSL